MKRRIFIAINLPEDVKKALASHQEKIDEMFASYRNEVAGAGPIRWTKKDNLHITLMFLGYLTDEELLEVCRITKEVAAKHSPFPINLHKILYGPPKKPPRMVWAEGEKSVELGEFQKDLEKSLLTSSVKGLEEEARPYAVHITLGRMKMWEFRQIERDERPAVDEDINLTFEVNSIEVMESKLKRVGPDYLILESCPLKN